MSNKQLDISNFFSNVGILFLGLNITDVENAQLILDYPDGATYEINIDGIHYEIRVDKNNIIYSFELNLEENIFLINYFSTEFKFDSSINFCSFIEYLDKVNIKWNFFNNRIYFQNIAIKLDNGLIVLYSFGNKSDNDYGLYKFIRCLDSHFLLP